MRQSLQKGKTLLTNSIAMMKNDMVHEKRMKCSGTRKEKAKQKEGMRGRQKLPQNGKIILKREICSKLGA